MAHASLDPRLVRMPDFAGGEWLNVDRPLTKEQLRGRVLLIDFWDYSCHNCVRAFPYLVHWHDRYADKGLTIIGVHTPEFSFGHFRVQVERAVSQYALRYPVLLDNHYATWSLFANKGWPTRLLVDMDGYIRLTRQGPGYYLELEEGIQSLLRQRDPLVYLPDPLPPLRPEDKPGTVCYRSTPDLYAGYQGGGLFAGALGNPEGYVPGNPMFYKLPETREEGQFFVEGVWRAWPEALAYAGRQAAKIILPYQAATVNAVLSPSADTVEVALEMSRTEAEPIIVLKQDGKMLDQLIAGEDVHITEDGTSYVIVKRPRLYQLVKNPALEAHELEMEFRASGLALYLFSFSGSVVPGNNLEDLPTYRAK